jgi:hypothetical protein
MADVVLNPNEGNVPERKLFAQIAGSTVLTLNLTATAAVAASYASAASSSAPQSLAMEQLHLKTDLANSYTLAGVSFDVGAKHYVGKVNGDLHVDLSPVTGLGTKVGTITPAQGEVLLDQWVTGAAPLVSNFRGAATAPVNSSFTPFNTYGCTFRIATAPIRTGSFSVLGTLQDGTTFNVSADGDGFINTPRVKGTINYTSGIVNLFFTTPTAPAGATKISLAFLGIPGVGDEYIDQVRQETLRYNAVAFTYLPLDADLLGIDPVRLPSDGRVPIFRPGELAVVGHTATTAPAVAVDGGVVDCGRVRLSRVRVLGSDNHVIETGYTEDLEAGTVTWVDVTGYAQPVRVEHRIEDMALIRDAQIDGTVTFTRPLTHVFPLGSYISSCLRSGDLKARVSLSFDQATWDNVTFSDVPGTPAPGTYNTTAFPVVVKNNGAITERWVLKFTSTLNVDVIGEHIGNIGNFPIASVIAPVNPITGEPYFTMQPAGWGAGWQAGNIHRQNTVGAMFPVWMVRTVQQGPEAAADYSFLTIVRGDVDNPLV